MLLPEEQGTLASRSGKKARHLSVFGNYIKTLCRYLHCSQRALARSAGIGETTLSDFVTNPDKEPARETVERLIVAVESIAKEQKRPLPHGWYLEFTLSARAECADGMLYLAYFQGRTMREEELARIERLALSMQTTANIVRGRSRSEK